MRKIPVIVCVLSQVFFGCSPNNVIEDNSIKKYFDENKVTGCFGQFNNTQGDFTIYNLSRFADSTYLPAATFNILNSVIALDRGVVNNDSAVLNLPVDPANFRAMPALPMYQAFRTSYTPWFQELARRTGRDTLQHWIDSLGYGSRYGKPVIGKVDTFWLDNSIKITADEQLGMIKKLYFKQLPFKEWSQRLVKNMMTVETKNEYKLAYTIGAGVSSNGHSIGWVVGWIEENKHPYPFVLQVESADADLDIQSTSLTLLNSILKHYGFKEGKK